VPLAAGCARVPDAHGHAIYARGALASGGTAFGDAVLAAGDRRVFCNARHFHFAGSLAGLTLWAARGAAWDGGAGPTSYAAAARVGPVPEQEPGAGRSWQWLDGPREFAFAEVTEGPLAFRAAIF
jgi:hypothetical protein